MASNEIAERMIAAAWIRVEPVSTLNQQLDPAKVSFRSAVGIKTARIITTDAPTAFPLLVVELEVEENRQETIIHFNSISSVTDPIPPAGGLNYPNVNVVFASPQVYPSAMALHTDWFGPDLANPLWVPFAIDTSLQEVDPAFGFNLDVYNAVAFLLPQNEAPPVEAQDICFSVWKLPRAQGVVTVFEQVIVIPD